jgi:DNA repair photolyase
MSWHYGQAFTMPEATAVDEGCKEMPTCQGQYQGLCEATCKNALVKTGIPGYDHCFNPYTGCAHACRYCYAETILRFRRETVHWGEYVAAKVNFPEVLAHKLKRHRRPLGRLLFGTVTDAYQPAEAQCGLTRASLEALADLQPEADVTILTKSDLVERDIDVLKHLKNCSVAFTITLVDDEAAALFEPGAPPPCSP